MKVLLNLSLILFFIFITFLSCSNQVDTKHIEISNWKYMQGYHFGDVLSNRYRLDNKGFLYKKSEKIGKIINKKHVFPYKGGYHLEIRSIKTGEVGYYKSI